jgi:hypothetical protein
VDTLLQALDLAQEGSDLLSDLRGDSRAHNTSSRGIRRRHFTHYLLPGVVSASIFGVLC